MCVRACVYTQCGWSVMLTVAVQYIFYVHFPLKNVVWTCVILCIDRADSCSVPPEHGGLTEFGVVSPIWIFYTTTHTHARTHAHTHTHTHRQFSCTSMYAHTLVCTHLDSTDTRTHTLYTVLYIYMHPQLLQQISLFFMQRVVHEMNRLGMLVDISHVSADTMRATLNVTKAPGTYTYVACYIHTPVNVYLYVDTTNIPVHWTPHTHSCTVDTTNIPVH